MIKLVVLDWNGTLIADLAAVTFATNAKLMVYGKPPITSKQYRDIFEIPAGNMYIKLGVSLKNLEIKTQDASKAFHEVYEARVANIRTRRGARQILGYLHKQRVKTILFSNHTLAGIQTQLERLHLAHYFDTVLANDSVTGAHFLGKKDRLITYLASVNVAPSDILIIGDSIEEITIGKELGLHTVAITGGFNTIHKLKAAKPDFLIHKLTDLIPILEQL